MLVRDKAGRFLRIKLDDCRSWSSRSRAGATRGSVTEIHYHRNGFWIRHKPPEPARAITEPEAAEWFAAQRVDPPLDLLGDYFPNAPSSSTTTSAVAGKYDPGKVTVDPRLLGYAPLDSEVESRFSHLKPTDNSIAVLKEILERGPIQRKDIAVRAHCSPRTVDSVIAPLRKEGLVVRRGKSGYAVPGDRDADAKELLHLWEKEGGLD